MTLEARVWKIDSDRPQKLKSSRLDQERRLEDWLCRDVSLLSDKLLDSLSGVNVDSWVAFRRRGRIPPIVSVLPDRTIRRRG